MGISLPKPNDRSEDVKENGKQVICTVEDSGAISVELIGSHMDKRTLLRVIKAIRLKYRHSIILYRRHMMANRVKIEQENKRETEKITEGVIGNG